MLLFLDKKKEGSFQFLKRQNWFAILDFWKGTCKWKESGLNLVNYTERVSETGKLTTLSRTCVYGIAETKQTKYEKGKSFLFFCPFFLNEWKQRMITFLLRYNTKLIHEDLKRKGIHPK